MCDHIYAIADNNAYGRARPASMGGGGGGGGDGSGGRSGAEEMQEQEQAQEEEDRRRKITDKALEEVGESFVGVKAEKQTNKQTNKQTYD